MRIFLWRTKLFFLNLSALLTAPVLHRRVINKVRQNLNSGRPIEVYFLLSQPALWWSNNLIASLRNDQRFRVVIAVFKDHEHPKPSDSLRQNLIFAGSIDGVDEVLCYPIRAENRPRHAIVFYQQPSMALPRAWQPFQIARKNLITYVPYGFKVSGVGSDHFNLPLHNLAWLIFAESAWHESQFQKHGYRRGKNVVLSGYPKFDDIRDLSSSSPRQTEPKKVMYAPHWSVNDSYLGYGTFYTFADHVRTLAIEHDSIHWTFKPHPRLKRELVVDGRWSLERIEDYFSWWADQTNTSLLEGGNYIRNLVSQDALITDSGSFIAEFFPSARPMLLLRSDESVGYNEFGDMLLACQYSGSTPLDLEDFILQQIVGELDLKYAARRELLGSLQMFSSESSSQGIYSSILNNIYG